jgi:AAA+ superfamily predicted ATPase
MLDIDRREVSVHSDFIMLLQNPSADTTFKEFFSKTKKAEIPLEYHQVKEKKVFQIIRLLEKKPQKSNHILLYGAPGTGKTSFARALPGKVRSGAYEIQRESTNRAEKRRAAIEACLNMTNSDEGSVVIVDEADNLLNTRFSWLLRGETQDKGWLNDLMERPGVRMIWIVNDIENIEPSVLRRFTFSLQFKSFNTSQRMQLWDRIVRKHGIKRFFKSDDISNYAKKYCVSAGVIDQAVATIAESAEKKRSDVLNSMDILLNSYVELINGENHDIQKKSTADAYEPEVLNISLELSELERQLKRFDKHLKISDDKSRKQFNLLFYGPPGTGKSELARYFANQIGRMLRFK